MGEVEIDSSGKQIIIRSNIITYGNHADEMISKNIAEEIETMWNEPAAVIPFQKNDLRIVFRINWSFQPNIQPEEIYSDVNPQNNFFRIENFAPGNISFVDDINCNSGFFLKENLYKGSTTAAHEYGHTIGLRHPIQLDIRGRGNPGIMYPRGTLVDPQFQYEPYKPAGQKGGTLNPVYRKVLLTDILDLRLNTLSFNGKFAVLGAFTNIYHTALDPGL